MFSDGLLAACRRIGTGLTDRVTRARANATAADWLRFALLATICLLLAVVAANVATSAPADNTTLQRGTVTQPADNTTIVSVQGYTFEGSVNDKKPARLIAADERAGTDWTYQSRQGSGAWFFDVDPLDDGNLLVVSPRSGETLIYELNPETRERVWERRFPFEDTHDADMLSEDELVIGHMRAWNETSEVSNDEVVVYNLTTDEITWRWRLREHFDNDTDGGMNADWSHLNDVDQVGEHRLLLSPRNFDQAIVVDRRSGEIVQRLGRDDDYSVLNEQHNPDYLVGENGTPTMLVADSGNDRVVEYARLNGSWERTWEVGTGSLKWPRDADRLPNGNTLIVDSLNHRVIEVTPTGEIVWEYYATWGPYDAERRGTGDESNGPTIRQQNATGSYELSGSAGLRPGTGDNLDFPSRLQATFSGTLLSGPANALAQLWGHYMPWFRPVWLSSWDAAFLIGAGLLGVSWAGGEAIVRRKRLVGGLRRRLPF
ncbi:aryl-sulfate sulfotransferase [Halomicrobium katesii]|uniref:aryl-sulfate sulfotransferase n=1 Tax=Halomicrobium katesii TaxID=437163 RepID=UPI00035CBDB8|nr:aryl-sulfate sulfotransferase [Halomicrobium katesii]